MSCSLSYPMQFSSQRVLNITSFESCRVRRVKIGHKIISHTSQSRDNVMFWLQISNLHADAKRVCFWTVPSEKLSTKTVGARPPIRMWTFPARPCHANSLVSFWTVSSRADKNYFGLVWKWARVVLVTRDDIDNPNQQIDIESNLSWSRWWNFLGFYDDRWVVWVVWVSPAGTGFDSRYQTKDA